MPLCKTDVFKVVVLAAGADTFLRGGGAIVVALLETEEDVLELVHAGVGEEQRGIAVRNERGAADAAMAFALKEFEEGLADIVSAPLQVGTVAAQVSLDSQVRSERKLSQRVVGSPTGCGEGRCPHPRYFCKDVILKGLRESMAQECESRGVAVERDLRPARLLKRKGLLGRSAMSWGSIAWDYVSVNGYWVVLFE
jgi:hypothetical protein